MHTIPIARPSRGSGRGRALVFAGLALLLPLVGTVACGEATAPDPAVRLEERSLHLDGFTRSYRFIRPVASGDQPRPLLLLYHGSGGDARELVEITALASTALEAGMIVAALEAVPGYGGRWATNPVDLEIVDDLTFTRAVVDALAEELPLDRTRVFAVGYSRGGEFVYQLACRAPELVRGVAAVSATLLRSNLEWCEETASEPPSVSVTMVLGSADSIIPWEGGPKRMGALETMAYWRERSGCPPSGVESLYPARSRWEVSLTSFAPCAHGDVRLFRVVPLTHLWPGVAFDVESAIIGGFMAAPAGSANVLRPRHTWRHVHGAQPRS